MYVTNKHFFTKCGESQFPTEAAAVQTGCVSSTDHAHSHITH